jgi:hypothetical protein
MTIVPQAKVAFIAMGCFYSQQRDTHSKMRFQALNAASKVWRRLSSRTLRRAVW